MQLIRHHADRGADVAGRIERLGQHSITLAVGLDTISVFLALTTALMMVRVVRRYSALVEERADELELFAGRVAHDLLSPLGAAGLALDFAARDAPAGGALARMVARGQAGLRRARTLADALLQFARAGARPAPGERADVGEVVRAIADEVELDARARGVSLQLELASPGVVACSAGMLTSIVSNLVRNAIKYVGDGPDRRVVVRARPMGRFVRLEVEDNGPGLPEGLGARSFEPYVRGPGSREPGIGLGLATVKKIAEAHGGKVDVRSVTGRGARFGVELPVATAGPLGPIPPQGLPSGSLRKAGPHPGPLPPAGGRG
jgi:signal transduction histidine kinase